MADYGIIRTDSVPQNIRSARFYVSTTLTAIENGNLVQVDVLIDTANRELFKAIVPAAITSVNLGVVASPELIYDESTHKTLGEFINIAGSNITVILPEKGTFLSVSDECITPIDDLDDIVALGNYLIPTAGTTKWTEVTSLGGTETLAGKIIARELYKVGKYLNAIEIVVGY